MFDKNKSGANCRPLKAEILLICQKHCSRRCHDFLNNNFIEM